MWGLIARVLARPAVANWLINRAKRRPYSPIVKNGDLYMERWWLFNPYPDTGGSGKDRPRWQFPISIRIHHIVLPDQDRHLHDHPWNARTVILRGRYVEERRAADCVEYRTAVAALTKQFGAGNFGMLTETIERPVGSTATLAFGEYHRITEVSPGGVYTMFITGPYRGTWGFLVDGVKVQWRKYLGL